MARLWLLLAVLMGGVSLAQSALALEVLQRTNQVRIERGLRPLHWDPLAYKAALGHAKDMLKRSFFAHQKLPRSAIVGSGPRLPIRIGVNQKAAAPSPGSPSHDFVEGIFIRLPGFL